MCEAKKEIKFCTCLGEEKADWKLTRNAKTFSHHPHVMGRWMQSQKDIDDDNTRAEILSSLKNNSLLDIEDYVPTEGDILQVYNLGIYHYTSSDWKMISSYHPFGTQVSVRENNDSVVFTGKIE